MTIRRFSTVSLPALTVTLCFQVSQAANNKPYTPPPPARPTYNSSSGYSSRSNQTYTPRPSYTPRNVTPRATTNTFNKQSVTPRQQPTISPRPAGQPNSLSATQKARLQNLNQKFTPTSPRPVGKENTLSATQQARLAKLSGASGTGANAKVGVPASQRPAGKENTLTAVQQARLAKLQNGSGAKVTPNPSQRPAGQPNTLSASQQARLAKLANGAGANGTGSKLAPTFNAVAPPKTQKPETLELQHERKDWTPPSVAAQKIENDKKNLESKQKFALAQAEQRKAKEDDAKAEAKKKEDEAKRRQAFKPLAP